MDWPRGSAHRRRRRGSACTISGLISTSSITAALSTTSRCTAITAAITGARSAAGRPRHPASSRAIFSPPSAAATAASEAGTSRQARSSSNSASTPPAPSVSTKPCAGSLTTPTISSATTPPIISSTRKPFGRHRPRRRRDRFGRAKPQRHRPGLGLVIEPLALQHHRKTKRRRRLRRRLGRGRDQPARHRHPVARQRRLRRSPRPAIPPDPPDPAAATAPPPRAAPPARPPPPRPPAPRPCLRAAPPRPPSDRRRQPRASVPASSPPPPPRRRFPPAPPLAASVAQSPVRGVAAIIAGIIDDREAQRQIAGPSAPTRPGSSPRCRARYRCCNPAGWPARPRAPAPRADSAVWTASSGGNTSPVAAPRSAIRLASPPEQLIEAIRFDASGPADMQKLQRLQQRRQAVDPRDPEPRHQRLRPGIAARPARRYATPSPPAPRPSARPSAPPAARPSRRAAAASACQSRRSPNPSTCRPIAVTRGSSSSASAISACAGLRLIAAGHHIGQRQPAPLHRQVDRDVRLLGQDRDAALDPHAARADRATASAPSSALMKP